MLTSFILPASVFGYYRPDYEAPGTTLLGPAFQILSASASLKRSNFANLMIYTGIPLTPTSTDRPAGTSLDLLALEVLAPEPEQLVESLNVLLFYGTMSAQMREEVTEAVSSIPATGATLYGSFGLLYGYPTIGGTFTFTIQATDGKGCSGSRNYAVTINSGLQTPAQQRSADKQ